MSYPENTNELVLQIREKLPEVFAIYLFGSAYAGTMRDDSDIDIAVLGKDQYNKTMLWDLSQALALFAKRDIDLLDMKALTTVMQYQILHEGECIYLDPKQKYFVDDWETLVYGKYLRLNEMRQEIFKDIKNRGSIYGG